MEVRVTHQVREDRDKMDPIRMGLDRTTPKIPVRLLRHRIRMDPIVILPETEDLARETHHRDVLDRILLITDLLREIPRKTTVQKVQPVNLMRRIFAY